MDQLQDYIDLCLQKSRDEFLREVQHAFLVELTAEGAKSRISRTVYQEEATTTTSGKAPLSDPEARVVKVIRKATGSFTTGDKVFLGRAPEADIQLPLGTVSKSHAYISADAPPAGYFIFDVRSTNGTFLNGRRIQSEHKHPLPEGVVISLGQEAHFAFYTPAGIFDQYGLG